MICELCNSRQANQSHHCFSQTKQSKKHYGKLIDADFNKVPACSHCNSSHANIPKDYKWDEKEFRWHAKHNGFELREPMKSFPSRLKQRRKT